MVRYAGAIRAGACEQAFGETARIGSKKNVAGAAAQDYVAGIRQQGDLDQMESRESASRADAEGAVIHRERVSDAVRAGPAVRWATRVHRAGIDIRTHEAKSVDAAMGGPPTSSRSAGAAVYGVLEAIRLAKDLEVSEADGVGIDGVRGRHVGGVVGRRGSSAGQHHDGDACNHDVLHGCHHHWP